MAIYRDIEKQSYKCAIVEKSGHKFFPKCQEVITIAFRRYDVV